MSLLPQAFKKCKTFFLSRLAWLKYIQLHADKRLGSWMVLLPVKVKKKSAAWLCYVQSSQRSTALVAKLLTTNLKLNRCRKPLQENKRNIHIKNYLHIQHESDRL